MTEEEIQKRVDAIVQEQRQRILDEWRAAKPRLVGPPDLSNVEPYARYHEAGRAPAPRTNYLANALEKALKGQSDGHR